MPDSPQRTFDKGNELVTNQMRKLRREVQGRLESQHGLLMPAAGSIEEADSKESVFVGASDLAAGYARELSTDGLTRVRDAFDLVVLNGEVLRR